MHVLLIPISYKSKFNHLSSPFFRDQAIALKNQGCKVGVICPLAISFKQIWKSKSLNFKNECYSDDGVKTLIYPFVSIPKSPERTRRIRLSEGKEMFKQYIQKNGLPDIVHSHVFLAAELALWIKETYGIPYVVTEHSSIFERRILSTSSKTLAQRVFDNSDMNFSVSKSLIKSIINQIGKFNFEISHNLIDIELFHPIQKQKNDHFNFISIGNLDHNKNHAFLIDEFTKCFKGNKNVSLVIVGDGLLFKKHSLSIVKHGMQSQISMLGFKSRNEVVTLLQNSNCLIHTSKVETFGVVLIEAMACGIPVLSTRSGGPESIITDDSLGILSNTSDFENNILKISKMNFDENRLRSHVLNNFSCESISLKLIRCYNNILSKNII